MQRATYDANIHSSHTSYAFLTQHVSSVYLRGVHIGADRFEADVVEVVVLGLVDGSRSLVVVVHVFGDGRRALGVRRRVFGDGSRTHSGGRRGCRRVFGDVEEVVEHSELVNSTVAGKVHTATQAAATRSNIF